MKIGLALRELHRAEKALVRELLKVSDRHKAEHEIHHVARDLARWSEQHVRDLAEAGRRYGVDLGTSVPSSGPLGTVREKASELSRGLAQPGMLLLADLRHLHRTAAGVSLDWELLAQGAQAVKDADLVALTQKCHPQTLRQMKWSNSMLKILSPQVLTS